MGKNNAASLLDKTLNEEEQTDQLLTDIAESYINIQADEEEEGSRRTSDEMVEAEAAY